MRLGRTATLVVVLNETIKKEGFVVESPPVVRARGPRSGGGLRYTLRPWGSVRTGTSGKGTYGGGHSQSH